MIKPTVFLRYLLLFLVFSYLPICACKNGKSSLPARQSGTSGARVPVDAIVIQPQLLENRIYTTGTLLANEEVELRPEIAGRVTDVLFTEGSMVRKGDVLIKINDRELKAQLKGKEIEEKQASDLEARARRLFEVKGISQEEYDKTANTLNMIKAQKEVIQAQLAKTEIVAPFDGIIGLRYVSQGSFVSTNMLVATMQDVNPIKVEFSVPEKYVKQIKKGTEITVQVGDSEKEYKGVVYAVESKIDLATRTIKSRAKIPNPNRDLIPGSFAKVEIILEQLPHAILVPSESVIPELNGEKVFICINGKARSIPVKAGIRTETGIQIVEGLNPQDTLILTGLLQLSDGKAVEIRDLQSNQR
ncbi:MAG: efflux RND transporter periplasmic adaptor subunit [candidate division Zixibacteria bacterium]|nr:efflux RND transporter periplasmic adaptor subunit [candidate division Zixibacteria bacterium]